MRVMGGARELVPTGIPGLDAMLGGGLPKRSVVLVRGGPGAGKTTLALQFLFEGVRRGERGLYITLEEGPLDIVQNASQYGWDFDGAIKSGALVIHTLRLSRVKDYLKSDAAQGNWIITMESTDKAAGFSGDFRAEALSAIISRLVRESGANRLVFDSLTMFTAQFEHKVDLHMETLDLVRGLQKEGCTTLFTAHQDAGGAHIITAEEYLSHGVISLQFLQQSGRFLQAIQVVKMRGARHAREMRPYRIADEGILVYPNETILGGI